MSNAAAGLLPRDELRDRLAKAEEEIERAADGLRLLSLRRDDALFHLLTVFEDRSRGTYLNHRRDDNLLGLGELANLKDSLRVLVPRILRQCVAGDASTPRLSWESYELAKEALEFGLRYSGAEAGYWQWHNGRYEAQIDGRCITFAGPSRNRGDRDAVGILLARYEEERLVRKAGSDLLHAQPSLPELAASVKRSARQTGETTITYDVDPLMIRSAELAAATGAPGPRVFPDASNGLYTVAEAHQVWRQLVMRAYWHTLYCLLGGAVGAAGGAVGSVVQVVDRDELEADVARRSSLPLKAVEGVVGDLVFPQEQKRADVRVYPLVGTVSGRLMLAPHLFLTANWETLLLRRWARDYSDAYGRSVAGRKRELARAFAGLFEGRGWLVSSNRPVRDTDRRDIGDVDVAVFAPEEKLLALFEVKWLIGPDDVAEVIRADDEITKGIGQVTRARDFARQQPAQFLAQVLPTAIRHSSGFETLAFVVSQGHVGSEHVQFGGVPVLAFDLSEDFLRQHAGWSLGSLCAAMGRLLDLPLAGRDYVLTQDTRRLAGWEISVPALAAPGYAAARPRQSRVGRNDRCPCGSGRKHKRCCDF